MPAAVAIAGLGLMGTAITTRLLEHGFPVHVWNRTPERARPLLDLGARWTDNPATAAPRLVLCLYSSDAVDEVLDRFQDSLQPGLRIVDTTTGAPDRTRAIASRLARRGVAYLDAPISGSSDQTRRGQAVALVGGPADDFHACDDLWPVLAARTLHVGPHGSAATLKLVTNLVLGLNRAALAEGLAFAESLGIPPATALEVLTHSNAYSRAIDVKGRRMVQRDYLPPDARLSQHLKDLRLILSEASTAGLPLPLADTHRNLLERAEAAGLGDADNAAVLEVLRRQAPPARSTPGTQR